jgi:glycosyltransferase involved in cell wall biosynthesis
VKKNKFVFVTPAFNCESEIRQTLFSMMSQSYDDWRAIIINDISTDQTLNTINRITQNSPFYDRFTIVNNEQKMGEVRNTLNVANQIEDDEIVCRVDGGDWITENDTLHFLNTVYQNDNVDVAWTSHRWAYTGTNISGNLHLEAGQTVYQHPWVSSHMKTFRCSRLRKVPDANFRDQDGNYIMIACDQAIFLPMIHTAIRDGKVVGHVPLVCYHYSIDLQDKNLFYTERSYRQKGSAEWIRARGFVE